MNELISNSEGSNLALSGAGEVASVAREQAEIQSRMVIAAKFPRDTFKAVAAIMKELERPELAEDASYEFRRGGSKISGPSVILARSMARHWRNLHYGTRVVSVDDDFIHIRSFAIDLETNTVIEAEDKFPKRVQRKGDGGKARWIFTDDERDLRELQNRRAALSVRNCILQLLPSDIVNKALSMADKTFKSHLAKELKENPEDALQRIVIKFDRIGVSVDMLTKYLKHPLNVTTSEELQGLYKMCKSIEDGVEDRAKYFEFGANASERSAATNALNEKLKSELAKAKDGTGGRTEGAA